jgi:hypothetical protein
MSAEMQVHGSLPGDLENSAARLPAHIKARLWPLAAFAMLTLVLALFSPFVVQRVRDMQALAGIVGARSYSLQGTRAAPGASGYVVIAADGEAGALVADHLPRLDENHHYQVAGERHGSSSGAAFPWTNWLPRVHPRLRESVATGSAGHDRTGRGQSAPHRPAGPARGVE